jgi:hypothetical protein
MNEGCSMDSKIIDRYDITPDNRFIIDVNIPGPDELFEKYDENASFYKKDLNARFEDYLLACVDEIGLKNNFIIRLGLPEEQAKATDEGDIVFSFKEYFKYCIFICQKEIKAISLRMLLHMGLAISALLLMVAFDVANAMDGNGFFSLVVSGLPAAVCVLLLTGFSRFLFRLMSQLSEIRTYRALKNAPVDFVYRGGGA